MLTVDTLAFPQTLTDLEDGEKKARAAASSLRLEAQRINQQSGKTEAFARLLHSLRTSWSERDPGKYGPALFLLDKDGKRVCAEELLPEGAIRFTSDEWSALSWQERDRHRNNVVRGYPVIPFAEVLTQMHPKKGKPCPVLEYYLQTDDSPEGDEWQKSRVMLDFDNQEVFMLSSETSPYRF